MTHRKGQGIVEAIVALLLVTIATSGIIRTTGAIVEQLWLKNVLYEALICCEQTENANQCKREAQRQTQYLPWAKNKTRIRLHKRTDSWSGEISWKEGDRWRNVVQMKTDLSL